MVMVYGYIHQFQPGRTHKSCDSYLFFRLNVRSVTEILSKMMKKAFHFT